jgi:hypothetical protein
MFIAASPSIARPGVDDLRRRRDRLELLLSSLLRRLAGQPWDDAPPALQTAIAEYEAELAEVRRVLRVRDHVVGTAIAARSTASGRYASHA